LDTSFSPQGEQFRRLQAVAEEIVKRDVGPNDLVFLIQIQSSFDFTEPFQMPAGTTLASKERAADQALSDAKAEVLAAIHRTKQNAGTTDLKSTLEVALDLLRQQPHAKQRLLVMGTDFLSDRGSVNPNPPMSRCRAAGVDTLLLVTYPKPKYLRAARLTALLLDLAGVNEHAVLHIVGSKRWSVTHFLRTIQYLFEYGVRFSAA
jgi:hypothetical protein